MAGIIDAIGGVVSKVLTFVPGKFEGLKNEKERLIDERSKILSSVITDKSADRLIVIGMRIKDINTALGNKASDD